MNQEQFEMDTYELREENSNLKRQIQVADAAKVKAEKKAAAATAELKRRKDTEQKEAVCI